MFMLLNRMSYDLRYDLYTSCLSQSSPVEDQSSKLERRRIQAQTLNRQLERIIPRITPGNIKIKSSTFTIRNIHLGHNKSVTGSLIDIRRCIGGIFGTDFPDRTGEDFTSGRDDTGATAGDVFVG